MACASARRAAIRSFSAWKKDGRSEASANWARETFKDDTVPARKRSSWSRTWASSKRSDSERTPTDSCAASTW